MFKTMRTASSARYTKQFLRNTPRRAQTNQTTSSTVKEASRIARIESRTPRFLRKYLTPLRNAPISHISAFLILHEITAIAPLLALTAAFHYSNWLPPFISEWKWFSDGVTKFGNYLRKKGWIGDENKRGRWFGRGENASRVVVEIATAYALTKALLPLRLILSVWATPWFARWTVLPITDRISKLFRRSKATSLKNTNAAGTGAAAAGVVPKKPS
ncbi:MIOREX complex component 11 [Pseudocercospora fuligena]|uniref:MIOREX complex component 11 n=1 Tax=Pseudocercospora fuligena TaxID=685502 RepID=A0A8H6R6K1_9PEZI|nr:MIOREX complex component 11 [Pseudocercospora fuligena]